MEVLQPRSQPDACKNPELQLQRICYHVPIVLIPSPSDDTVPFECHIPGRVVPAGLSLLLHPRGSVRLRGRWGIEGRWGVHQVTALFVDLSEPFDDWDCWSLRCAEQSGV